MRRVNVFPVVAIGLLLATGVSGGAAAQEGDAKAALKSMTDYLASQDNFSFQYDTVLEVVTTDLQKIQFTSSGQAAIARPNRFHIERTGGFTDAELISDGETLYVHGKKAELFAEAPAPASLDELFARLGDLGIEVPVADILTSDAYEGLVELITDEKVIGPAIVNGKECQLFAFRTPQVDWAIWISAGDEPLPCRYVVTSKHLAQAPQYTIQFSDWQIGTDIPANMFNFAPGDAKKVDLEMLFGLDELPSNAEGEAR
jgi:hypothetical protein